ncbi:PIN domain-containing protein [Longimicrobium sp.]|uniref:PIN domain-containing protein n=1 Tax=Longimicrobium sp. TaxID=2029185 RepID=UPI002CC719D4|nr:PIN domain-containing protein [Longimicrobium sp.]HSU15302.1 PIN domain-containing protein [Longimicrobium sp.]
MILLDSDVLIDVQRGYAPAAVWLDGLREQPSVPGFVVMELVQSARNSQEVEKALRFVSRMAVVWPDERGCAAALEIFSRLHLSHSLGLLDALIAATALRSGAPLCTFNLKHFRAVPGLVTMQPYPK